MFAKHDVRDFVPSGAALGAAPDRQHLGSQSLTLVPGDMLFRDGDPRHHIYRVETGAVCHYIPWKDGRYDVIEFAFPGDVIGFGDLPNYVTSAQAVTATVVSLVNENEFETALKGNPGLAMRVAAAADREFELLKSRSVASGVNAPLARLAAYLLTVAGGTCDEATVAADDVTGGFVTDALKMSDEDIQSALEAFAHEGLLTRTACGWKINDAPGLDRVASAA